MSVIVQDYRVIGTPIRVFVAYEPTKLGSGQHSTITNINGSWYGRIGTRTHQQDEYERAYQEILRVHPELANNPTVRYDMGQIEIVEEC
jgi:hypothetical protein